MSTLYQNRRTFPNLFLKLACWEFQKISRMKSALKLLVSKVLGLQTSGVEYAVVFSLFFLFIYKHIYSWQVYKSKLNKILTKTEKVNIMQSLKTAGLLESTIARKKQSVTTFKIGMSIIDLFWSYSYFQDEKIHVQPGSYNVRYIAFKWKRREKRKTRRKNKIVKINSVFPAIIILSLFIKFHTFEVSTKWLVYRHLILTLEKLNI